jgi:hypothetical protein
MTALVETMASNQSAPAVVETPGGRTPGGPQMPAPAYKRCSKCGEDRPLDDFYRDRAKADGRRASCKECTNVQILAWRRANPESVNEFGRRYYERHTEKERARNRRYSDQHPDKVLARAERAHERHPEKRRARNAVTRAVTAGRLTRPSECERCGSPGKPYRDGRASIQAHHHDYGKPLDVEWLCPDCHKIADEEVRAN